MDGSPRFLRRPAIRLIKSNNGWNPSMVPKTHFSRENDPSFHHHHHHHHNHNHQSGFPAGHDRRRLSFPKSQRQRGVPPNQLSRPGKENFPGDSLARKPPPPHSTTSSSSGLVPTACAGVFYDRDGSLVFGADTGGHEPSFERKNDHERWIPSQPERKTSFRGGTTPPIAVVEHNVCHPDDADPDEDGLCFNDEDDDSEDFLSIPRDDHSPWMLYGSAVQGAPEQKRETSGERLGRSRVTRSFSAEEPPTTKRKRELQETHGFDGSESQAYELRRRYGYRKKFLRRAATLPFQPFHEKEKTPPADRTLAVVFSDRGLEDGAVEATVPANAVEEEWFGFDPDGTANDSEEEYFGFDEDDTANAYGEELFRFDDDDGTEVIDLTGGNDKEEEEEEGNDNGNGNDAVKNAPTGRWFWTKEEDRILLEGYRRLGPTKWDEIQKLLPGRTLEGIRSRYRKIRWPIQEVRKLADWTEEEDKILREGYRRLGPGKWDEIQKLLPGRTNAAIRTRYRKRGWPTIQAERRLSNEWTEEEDQILREGYRRFKGPGKWDEIRKLLPRRTEAAIRARYCMKGWPVHLKRGQTNNRWTKDEDQILLEGYRRFGNKWEEVQQLLPGRTCAAIQVRFNSKNRGN